MIQDAINSMWAALGDKIGGFWAGLWAPITDGWPLWWSYGVFGLIVIACFALAFFLQFKWVRLGLLVIIGLAGAWLFGRATMYNEMKAKLDAERKKRRNK